MNEQNRSLSYLIDESARAFSEWIVTRHSNLDPTLPQRYGEKWRANWVADTRHRLAVLAQAVAIGRTEVFAGSFGWSMAAFEAREVRGGDLVTSLQCMREILSSELPPESATPALETIDVALKHPPAADNATWSGALDPKKPHGLLALRYVEALLEGRRSAAESLILDAVRRDGVPVHDIYTHVFSPSLIEIGSMWHLDEVTVADEHFATGVTEGLMAMLRTDFHREPTLNRRAAVAGLTGDLHSVGIRMVGDFLEMAGWEVLCLGCNTPGSDLAEYLVHHEIHLLALSVTNTLCLRSVAELIQCLRGTEQLAALPIIVGGRTFQQVDGLWETVGADGMAATASEAPAVAEQAWRSRVG